MVTDVGRLHIITPQTAKEKEFDDLESREDLEFVNEDENIDYFSQMPDMQSAEFPWEHAAEINGN